MNRQLGWMVVCASLLGFAPAVHAQEDLPPVPMFDPANPLAGIPAPPAESVEPIAPDAMPEVPPVDGSVKPTAASDLPLPQGEESFEFFQPGYQMTDDGDDEEEKAPEPVVEIKPEPKKQARRALPLVRFNYKNQRLPYPIYKKNYDAHNRHLPTAMYESDYDAATFMAAMSNNVNALRAMINAGRNLEMRSPQGESLVAVAVRYQAHDALRYLLAKGADPYSAPPQQTYQAHYALQAAGYR